MTKCPSCGYMEPNLNKRQTNEMHKYVSSEDKSEIVLNDNAITVVLKGVTYTRKDKLAQASTVVGLREDGPTLEEYVAKGYDAKNYPPEGYAKRASSTPLRTVTEGLTGMVPNQAVNPQVLAAQVKAQFTAMNNSAGTGTPLTSGVATVGLTKQVGDTGSPVPHIEKKPILEPLPTSVPKKNEVLPTPLPTLNASHDVEGQP